MSIPESKQATSILQKSSSILLLVKENTSVDAFSSMLALSLTLRARTASGAEIDCVSPGHVPQELQFLPGSSQVSMQPHIKPRVTIEIAGISSLLNIEQHQLKGGLRIQLVIEENKKITADAIETHVQEFPYDCITTFGISDLGELSDIFTNHADFFYSTPIVNIDNKAANEHFGTINMVDITASSIAEITYELITELQENRAVDADIATSLYAGIVGATESFQSPLTTPRAFQVAAELMGQHAKTDTVIQQLVKTKPLTLLKLVGRAYARLRHDEHGRIFWSILRNIDFMESGATADHIPMVIQELTNNISGYNITYILQEHDSNQYRLYLSLGKGLVKRAKDIQKALSAQKEGSLLVCSIPAPNLEEAEKRAVLKVRDIVSTSNTTYS